VQTTVLSSGQPAILVSLWLHATLQAWVSGSTALRPVLVDALGPDFAVEASTKPSSIGLPGQEKSNVTPLV